MSERIIRRATKEDLPFVVGLWKEMMNHHLSVDPRFELGPDNEGAYLEYLYSIIDNYDYALFVAEHDARIVGYTIGMILANPQVFALGRYGFIAEMSVSADLQRQGAGRELWERVRHWFKRRGVKVIQLNVSPRNIKGYDFWKQLGCDEFLHILWHDIPKDA
ncbi:MAG: GNAT family N-acetyltransferase [Candidatus Hinthialibacter antarcticus]|nr:GNAT family N-acetyltransferase [Candidatus Hinthialibacter antarcticus]